MGKSKSTGGKMRASHILVQKHSHLLKIMENLEAGQKFDKLAREFSECPSKNKGGDLGYFIRGKMVPEFEKAVLALNVGEVSQPVKTKFGWHLIKRTA
ncbi:MAG: peptidyl-prolyl cis-trans isomerase [Candidatus Lokiarchaeota archaeon]|nr:peptidyl-prolyl cis-trans isomerase [Candidatus Lokiarchaeota archaeon]